MKRLWFCMILSVVGLWGDLAYAEGYVAMVMAVEGRATRVADGNGLHVMAFLNENDVVQVDDRARLVLMFFEPSLREAITGPATLTIGINGSECSAGREVRIRRESVDYLPPKARLDRNHHQNFGNIAFRKLEKNVDREAPLLITSTANAAYVPDAQPLLTWAGYPRADEFRLIVQGDSQVKIYTSKSLQMRMAHGVQTPGKYTWLLEARLQGKVIAQREGWFRIMTPEAFATMREYRQVIQAEYPAGGVEEMVMLAMLYQGYEMWNEMSLILLALHEKQPENVEIKHKLRSINPYLLERAERLP